MQQGAVHFFWVCAQHEGASVRGNFSELLNEREMIRSGPTFRHQGTGRINHDDVGCWNGWTVEDFLKRHVLPCVSHRSVATQHHDPTFTNRFGHAVADAFHLLNPSTSREFGGDDKHLHTVVSHAVDKALRNEGFASPYLALKQVEGAVRETQTHRVGQRIGFNHKGKTVLDRLVSRHERVVFRRRHSISPPHSWTPSTCDR